MKHGKHYLALLVCLSLAAASAGDALAGNERRTGTAGAAELRIPVGTRGLALGGATVAAGHGLQSIFYNPAGLASNQGVEALFSHTQYLADMDVRYFALATNQSFGNLAFTAKVLDIGDLYVTTEDAPEGTGQVESITFSVLGATFSRYLTDAISFGATGQYVSESVLNTSAHGLSFDLGLRYDIPWRDSRFGVVMKNFGTSMQYSGSDLEISIRRPGDDPQALPRILSGQSSSFELPSYFQIGGEIGVYHGGDNTLHAYGAYQSNNFSQDEARGGAEYMFRDVLAVRGGFVGSGQDDFLYGPTFGVGVKAPFGGADIAVDYAFQTIDSFFDDLHTFSANVRF